MARPVVIDTHAVCGLCLSEVLAPIVAQEHERSGRGLYGNSAWIEVARAHQSSKTMGVLDSLAAESGMAARRIAGILRGEFATVGLRNVDDLLVAFDRPDLLQLLDVFPRPRGKWMGEPGSHVGCRFAKNGRGASVETTTSPVTPGAGLAGPRPGRDLTERRAA